MNALFPKGKRRDNTYLGKFGKVFEKGRANPLS
jgi:hypothetical protein